MTEPVQMTAQEMLALSGSAIRKIDRNGRRGTTLICRYVFALYWITGLGFYVALTHPTSRRMVFTPCGRFSAHGHFFNWACRSGADLSPPAGLVMPAWAERVYGVFCVPTQLFWERWRAR
jgi:hypothetical protein